MADDHLHALPKGHRIEEYEIVRVLGAGGFGITYLAFDHKLDGPVALKEYFPAGAAVRSDGDTVVPSSSDQAEVFAWGLERFIEEARAIHRFRHPNVVRAHRYIEANGTAYIVMEHVEGESLAAVMEQHGRLTPEQWRPWFDALLDGLAHVHARGYLHRDIKPGNIVIRAADGQPMLIDFGAARVAAAERTHTQILSPAYAPIEQHSTKAKQGPFTDIYSLAAVSCHVLTGETPPSAPDRMLEDQHEPLASRLKDASRTWVAGIDGALALRPGDRPQTVAAWRAMFLVAGNTSRIGKDASPVKPTGEPVIIGEIAAKIDPATNTLQVESTGDNRSSPPPNHERSLHSLAANLSADDDMSTTRTSGHPRLQVGIAAFVVGFLIASTAWCQRLTQPDSPRADRVAPARSVTPTAPVLTDHSAGPVRMTSTPTSEAAETLARTASSPVPMATDQTVAANPVSQPPVPQATSSSDAPEAAATTSQSGAIRLDNREIFEAVRTGDGEPPSRATAPPSTQSASTPRVDISPPRVSAAPTIFPPIDPPDELVGAAMNGDYVALEQVRRWVRDDGLGNARGRRYLRWYRQAAADGHPEAQFGLGLMYANGEGVPRNDRMASVWLRRASEQRHPRAPVRLRTIQRRNSLSIEPPDELVTSAMNGDNGALAQIRKWVGDDGIGNVRGQRYLTWYRQAAQDGHPEAQFGLGLMYASGEGVLRDDRTAIIWLRRSAAQGHVRAQVDLGQIERRVTAEENEANAEALFNRGMIYASGDGVSQDWSQAVVWFRSAAEQGHASAQHYLGRAYAGSAGIRENLVTAYMWLAVAATNGFEVPARRARLERRMNQVQIAEAQRRARTCMRTNYQKCD